VGSFNQYLLENKSSPREVHRKLTSNVDDGVQQRLSALTTEAAAYKAKITELVAEKGIHVS
jgi:hypothetical protein